MTSDGKMGCFRLPGAGRVVRRGGIKLACDHRLRVHHIWAPYGLPHPSKLLFHLIVLCEFFSSDAAQI